MYHGLDHLALCASDPAALARWYCDHFGFREVSNTGATPPTIFIQGECGSAIEVMPAQTPPARGEFFDWGWRHIAIITTDFDAAMTQLAQLGVELVGPERTPIGGGRLQSFRDPEGNIAQILWRP